MNFRGENGRSFQLDARPSDAVAIATGVGARLLASETILDEIGIVEEEQEGEAGEAGEAEG